MPLTSLPNLALLQDAGTSVAGSVHPGLMAPPAPLGLADYGVGATTYSYNTSHLLGQVTFNTQPNASEPGSTGLIEPQAASLGNVGNQYEFGVQLNTVATNISIPGNDAAFFWTQNVVDWNDTGIHFVDDTFNLTAGTSVNYNTIYSACNNNTAGVDQIILVYGILQCVGGTIPVSSASYPVTIQLYNNATINAQNRTQVAYGYRIVEVGTGKIYTGVSDTVVFNNTAPNWQHPTKPANAPGFSIDGFQRAPYPLLRDAEIDLVGDIGGDNAVFRSLNGSINLEYSNASSGGWKNVPSAYNFGDDTGETSVGIASFWTPNHTEQVNQGPAMLYGLWNALPWLSVGSGDIQFSGSINPTYGFVFVGNKAPDVYGTNLSWMPTTNAGTFNTYLPPTGAPWTTTYYVQSFAAGSAESNGTFTATTTGDAIALTHAAGVLRAPLYAFSNAQIASLAKNVTASTSAPWVFDGLAVFTNYTFNHLNDYDFPSFEVFMTQGVTQAITVNNTYMAAHADSTYGTFYILDYNLGGSTGWFTPGGSFLGSWPGYTSGINIWDGVGDHVTNEATEAVYSTNGVQGYQIVLWQDTNAYVFNTLDVNGGPGVWVGDSIGTTVKNSTILASTGITDIGSTHTTGWNLFDDAGLAVLGLSSHSGTFSWINVTDGGAGVITGVDNSFFVNYDMYYDEPGTTGYTVNWLNVTTESLGANITFSSGTTLNHFSAYDPAFEGTLAVRLDGDVGTNVNNLWANYAGAVYMWNGLYTNLTNVDNENFSASYGSEWSASTDLTVTNLVLVNVVFGEFGSFDTAVTLKDVSVTNAGIGGVVLVSATTVTGTNLNSSMSEFAFEFDQSSGLAVNGVNAYADYIGLNVYQTFPATVTNAVIDQSTSNCLNTAFCAGVASYGTTGNTITTVSADNSTGVRLDGGTTTNTVSKVTATNGSTGVEINSSPGNTVTGVTASVDSTGVFIDPTNGATVSDVTASSTSVGVQVVDSSYVSVTTVAASGESIGVWTEGASWTSVTTATVTNMSVAVYSEFSDYTSITGVTATNTTGPSNPFGGGNPFHLSAVAAIVTYRDSWDSISNVVATMYPAGFYDYESFDTGMNNLNATGSWYAIYLDYTTGSVFVDIGAYQDVFGAYIYEGGGNVVTQSAFVDSMSYGVFLYFGSLNYIYDNTFIGNNGATGTYSAAHIQAYSGYGSNNYFYFQYVGNYWSDWHTYTQGGNLAPYPLGDTSWDYYPLGGPEGTFGVYFYGYGLTSGTPWSVTFNGATQTTSNYWVVFYVLPGSYPFTAGNVAGYSVMPASGTVDVTSSSQSQYIYYTAQYNVTFTESGLTAGTTWSATVGGVNATGTSPALTIPMGSGTYSYQITPVPGYMASPSSGTVTVVNGNYNVVVTFTKVVYTVTVTESGLSSGQSWSATINGNTQTSTGTAITFSLPNGTYTVSVANVSGYSQSASSVSLTVNGAPTGASVSFTPNKTTSVVSTDTFNMWLAVAIAIAVIALVLGLLALFLRRRREDQPAQPAQAWTPPPGEESTTSTTTTGSGTWSEGPPPAGGSPPS